MYSYTQYCIHKTYHIVIYPARSQKITIMSKDHNVHLIIRNTRPDDIEEIVKLQKESFPILARYVNIWHPDELKSHLQVTWVGYLG